MKSLSLLAILAISINAHSSCLENIRDHLAVPLSHFEDFELMKTELARKELRLENELNSQKTLRDRLSPKTKEFIKTLEENNYKRKLILLLSEIFFTPQSIKTWASDLAISVAREVYKEGSDQQKINLLWKGEVPKEIFVQILKERLVKAGFSKHHIKTLEEQLSPEAFGETLKDRFLIIDETFLSSEHGVYIHMLQLDLIRFTLNQSEINPKLISDFYSWMGVNTEVDISGHQVGFKPMNDIWEFYFDSFTWDLTSPEILNPMLEQYIGLRERRN